MGGSYGLTWEETVDVNISACTDGTDWTAITTSIIGNYSLQAVILAHQSEPSVAISNTTNFCSMVTGLNNLGIPGGSVQWYMQAAVQAHEEVHLAHFEPGLETVASQIEALFEVLSVPDAGQTQVAAIRGIKALANFSMEENKARTLWFNEDGTRLANDHNPGGPTDQAEQGVVNPMINNICMARTAAERSTCPVCPP